MPVNNTTASVRIPKSVSRDAPFSPVVHAREASASSDDVFAGTAKGSSASSSPSFNPFDPFGVAQFWMQNNPISLAQNLMLAAQVYSRGPFGGPFFMGPFY